MLTQSEADALLAIQKQFVNTKVLNLGQVALDETHDLISLDGREKFLLDIWRGGINLKKYRYNNRARVIYILARVDIGGPPHRNPDGEIVQAPHIHIYREGYGDKWAYPISKYSFSTPIDMITVLRDFAKLCNITPLPQFQLRAY